MRIFWAEDPDRIVADVLSEVLDACKADLNKYDSDEDIDLAIYGDPKDRTRIEQHHENSLSCLEECQKIIKRLRKNEIPIDRNSC
ncbi:MAG: hypothetical protein F4218_07635 [Synechococcus sp. SB0677_bin_5]|nr:hypothetical protein [Synechococcus sp. SB0677_bin_5]MYI87656.1 hypothetical protein [Synechococcus sp. SB0672_bin_10]